VAFTATSKNEILTDNIWICDSGACGHYCKSDKGLFDAEDINEKIMSMKATKIRSLKYHVIQLNGSSVNQILKGVKYIPEL
jgi:hypothetical protein